MCANLLEALTIGPVNACKHRIMKEISALWWKAQIAHDFLIVMSSKETRKSGLHSKI